MDIYLLNAYIRFNQVCAFSMLYSFQKTGETLFTYLHKEHYPLPHKRIILSSTFCSVIKPTIVGSE